MKVLRALSICLLACTVHAFDVDDFLERLDSTLTLSAFHDVLRARLSGTLDLEFYNFQQPAPGLIDSGIDNLFNPRLSLFLDAQAALKYASMNMRFVLRRGMTGVSICR